MRILLFGPSGQVGTEIQRRVQKAGAEIIAVGREVCDLAERGAARTVLKTAECDAVINAAAYSAVDKAQAERRLAEAVNAFSPGEIARACAARALPLIHFSTDYVFDGAASRPYVETDPTGPINVYGETKLNGEEGVASAEGAHAIIRTSWVFSAHGGNFVKTMLRLAGEKPVVRVVADQRGKPTAAGDLADAALSIVRVLKDDASKTGLYHYAGDEATSWAGFADAIFRAAGLEATVARITAAEYPTPARRPAYSVLDTEKVKEVFGIAPPSWRASLKDVVRELKGAAKGPAS